MRLLSSVIASTALYQAHAGFSHTQYLASHGVSPLSHAQTSAVLSYPPESLPASLAEPAGQVLAACEAPAQELCGTSLTALHTGSPDTAWHLRRRQLDCLARQATLPEACAAAGEALFEAVAEHQLDAQFQLAVQHVQTLEDQALTVCGLADDAKAQPSCNLTPYAMPSAGTSGSGIGDSGATSRALELAMEPATPMQQPTEGKHTRERHGKHKHVRGTDAQEHAEDAARMLKHQHHHEPRDEQPGQGPPPPPAAQLMQFGELVLLRERVHSGMQEKPPITSETKCVASSLNAQAVEATNSMSCQRLAGEYTDALRRVASMPQAGPGEMTGAVCAWPGLVPPPARGHGPPPPPPSPRDGSEEQETGELTREESRTVQGSTTTNTMQMHWRTSDRSSARAMQEQVPPRAPQTKPAPVAGPPGCMPGHEYPDSDFALAAAGAHPHGPHDGHHGHHHRHHSACHDIIGFVVFVAIAVLVVKFLRRVLCGMRGRCHRRHGGPGFWPRRHHHGHMPPPHHHHGHPEHHQELPPMAPPSAQSQAPPPPPPVAPTVVPRSAPVIHGNAPAPVHVDPTQLYPTVPSTGGYPHGYGRL